MPRIKNLAAAKRLLLDVHSVPLVSWVVSRSGTKSNRHCDVLPGVDLADDLARLGEGATIDVQRRHLCRDQVIDTIVEPACRLELGDQYRRKEYEDYRYAVIVVRVPASGDCQPGAETHYAVPIGGW